MKPYLFIFIVVSSLAMIFLSCSKDPEFKIPYGYVRDFDYLSVLKSSPGYSDEPSDDLPEFTYQDPWNDSLVKLKNTYNLDSVAGDGDELSTLLNLLNWVHNTISHDGGNAGPDPRNSMNILRYFRETGNGVNCIMMALVLNEAYLSMGFKSRVIHGNGKKWVFNGEWHAFNIVYSNSLDKWIFVDPTHNSYFLDEAGNMLSVAELREHLIQDETLILNEDADVNGIPLNKTDYLHYMSKNLYRFSCSVHSEFANYWIYHDSSDIKNRNFFHLDPQYERQDGLGLATNYFTSNANYYWSQ